MALLKSTIGQKVVVGVTGLIMAGFLMGHMAGNLLVFLGPAAFNQYGHALVSNKLIYVAEAVLLVSVLAHIFFTVKLTMRNQKAKPVSYDVAASGAKKTSLASKTMIVHGPILAIFIIIHLLGFKYGNYYEISHDGVVMRDLYRLMVENFAQPVYVGGYIICLLLLSMHLKHGVASVFNTLGIVNEKFRPAITSASWLYAIVVTGGFISQPLYVFLFLR